MISDWPSGISILSNSLLVLGDEKPLTQIVLRKMSLQDSVLPSIFNFFYAGIVKLFSFWLIMDLPTVRHEEPEFN